MERPTSEDHPHRRRVLDPNRPKVPDVLPLAIAYVERPGHHSGGNLHIVLEEQCIDDESIGFCMRSAAAEGDADAAEIASRMLRMSPTGRGKVARICSSRLMTLWRLRGSY